ncbi:MucBP domain-containing protein [Listeria grayi]|uniref:LPXTG-motif cell wall anchor domain protein n=1 Tax=Listeria grayi DSM 20601 TaxID=525367 RepID=D7UUV9_LISGR|nr:MucBP domain-containing protein [Listeria grayi]EFI85035.1 LPXTG-motif cell wall anchor domain protein [Listeria grayi DSM 20601]
MRKNIFISILICTIIFITVAPHITFAQTTDQPASTKATAEESIDTWMPDKVLQKAVAAKLGITDVNTLTKADMKRVTALAFAESDQNLSSLEGLQYADNLYYLYIPKSNISDISALTNLTKMSILYLMNSKIHDLTPLEKLTNMTNLHLDANPIADYSPILSLTKLTEFGSRHSNLKDVSFLKNATELRTIYLWGNDISDVSFLENMNQLQSLELSYNKLENGALNTIATRTTLQTLSLSGNQLSVVTPLESLHNLTNLTIYGNHIADISPIQSLPLTTLNGGNQTISLDKIAVKGTEYLQKSPIRGLTNNPSQIAPYPENESTGTMEENAINWTDLSDEGTFLSYWNETYDDPNKTFSGQLVLPYERATGEDVTVRYLDKDGEPIADSVTLNGKIGDPYTSEAKSIDGWELTETPDNAKGTFSDSAQTVSYIYEKTDAQPVTVRYLDKDGNGLAKDTILTGKIGEEYTSEPKSIDGWELAETPDNAKGNFSDSAQTVTYVYEKTTAQPVTVRYLDKDGNELAKDTILTGKIGEEYTSEPKSINGWELTETPDNAKGTFSDSAQVVHYVYKKTTSGPDDPKKDTVPKKQKPANKKQTSPKTNTHTSWHLIIDPKSDITKSVSKLPTTGDKLLDTVLYSFGGLLLIIIAFLLFKKRRKN